MNFDIPTIIVAVVIILLLGFWAGKKVWKWLNKKKFNVLEEHKWLKILVTVVCGCLGSVVFLIIGGFKLIFGIGSAVDKAGKDMGLDI